MTFVTLLAVTPAKNKETYSALKKLKAPPEVKITTALELFGEYDALLVYEAKSERVAMDFLLEVCKTVGVQDTKTFLALPMQ